MLPTAPMTRLHLTETYSAMPDAPVVRERTARSRTLWFGVVNGARPTARRLRHSRVSARQAPTAAR